MKKEIYEIVSFVASIFIIGSSMLVLIGYVLDVYYLRNWNGASDMALPTAFNFLAIGVERVVYLISIKNNSNKK